MSVAHLLLPPLYFACLDVLPLMEVVVLGVLCSQYYESLIHCLADGCNKKEIALENHPVRPDQ